MSWAILEHWTCRKTKPSPFLPNKKYPKSLPPIQQNTAKLHKNQERTGLTQGDPTGINVLQETESHPKLRKLFPTVAQVWLRFVTPAKRHITAMWLRHTVFCIMQSRKCIRESQKHKKNHSNIQDIKCIHIHLYLTQTSSLNFVSN